MRMNYSTENTEITKDGVLLQNTALDSPTTTGSFLKSHYNERTNMITSYYFDSANNKWIISSSPYQPINKEPLNLSFMVFPRASEGNGANRVFSWIPFKARRLL
jgi:hypothetical protein